MIYHLQNGMACSYEKLAEYMKMDKSNIGKSIRFLEKQGLLIIRKMVTYDGGNTYNHYLINNTNDTLEQILIA